MHNQNTVNPVIGTNSSGKITGAGANFTSTGSGGFVSAGAYKPAGAPTVFSGAAGVPINSTSSVYTEVTGNKNQVNAGIGFKTSW